MQKGVATTSLEKLAQRSGSPIAKGMAIGKHNCTLSIRGHILVGTEHVPAETTNNVNHARHTAENISCIAQWRRATPFARHEQATHSRTWGRGKPHEHPRPTRPRYHTLPRPTCGQCALQLAKPPQNFLEAPGLVRTAAWFGEFSFDNSTQDHRSCHTSLSKGS